MKIFSTYHFSSINHGLPTNVCHFMPRVQDFSAKSNLPSIYKNITISLSLWRKTQSFQIQKMASASTGAPEKTVTGYPAQSSQVAAGYPAYAYVAPPPSYGPGLGPNPVQDYYRRRNTFVCRVIAFGSVVFATMGLIFLIAWLVLKPRMPEFRVDSASVSELNLTQSALSADWNFTLFVRNPNTKLSVYYDRLEASVFYHGGRDGLSTTPLQPFSQPKGDQTRVPVRFEVMSEYVGEDVAAGISNEKSTGSVGFRLRVFALVKFRSGFWWTRERLLRVYCDGVQIGVDPKNGTGSLMGLPGACEVDL